MKENKLLISSIFSRFLGYSFAGNVFVFLFLILVLLSACAGKMSLQEAKQVAVSMNEKKLNAPPRRIDDILATLDHNGPYDPAIGMNFRTVLEKPRPRTDNAATLADYYYRRGTAARELGRYNQALSDLRLALDYCRQVGISNDKMLRSLAYAEFTCGNFKDAIELLKKGLRIKETPSTYKALVKLYARVGDLESAERVKNRGIAMCNRVRGQKGWGRWPVMHAAYMNASFAQAQGKFSEAERFYRQVLRNWTLSMKNQYPIGPIIYRAHLAQTLKHQDRLVEAEFEIRKALKAMGALNRKSEIFGAIIIELGEILLRQGRLQDAEKIMRAGLDVMEDASLTDDTYLMAEGRTRLGEVLTARQKFDDAMQQFDLARSGMQQNQYLYENNLARNPALMLSLVPGDLDGLDQPALALTSPSIASSDEDGLLTMAEILRLKLNADWVVLSACNTGTAAGKGAEAISGLGRAFFYAGTRAILVSMWPVETTSARELTTGLFRFQQEEHTLSRARALQKSALALIDGPGFKDLATGQVVASYAHPLFWAPFIMVGESGRNSN